MATKYSVQDCVDIANGKAQIEKELNWGDVIDDLDLKRLTDYCWAHQTELEYVLVPYFVMCGAVAGKETKIQSGMIRPGRTNLFVLVRQYMSHIYLKLFRF